MEIAKITSIELRNFSFKPANTDKYLLKKINLEITKDKSIVLVGLNGSGKTTLSKVLMGFYEEYEGEFYVNGVNFKRINKESYYRRVSAVFQDFVKYESTIRENISFGDVEKN